MRKKSHPKQESIADFKARIAMLMGVTALEAKRSNPLLVRKPSDRGYYPPSQRK